jgi:phosphatidylglycerophosphate synthase
VTQESGGEFARRRRRIGLAEVRASFRPSGTEPICLAYFARPLANLVTPAFYNAGLSADQVILIRLSVGLFALLLFALGIYWIAAVGLIIYAVAYILDCVDGNLSRLHDAGNYWGKFIDGFVDDVVLFTAPLAIGLGMWATNSGGIALAVGGIVSIGALLTGIARHRFGFVREWMVSRSGPLSDDETARIARFTRISDRPIRLVANLYCFAPWLILLPNGGWIYLGVMLVIGTSANFVWLAMLVAQANAVLRRRRQAVHMGETIKDHGQ